MKWALINTVYDRPGKMPGSRTILRKALETDIAGSITNKQNTADTHTAIYASKAAALKAYREEWDDGEDTFTVEE